MRHKKAWLLLMVTILGGCTTMQQSYPDSTPGQVWSAMIIVARDPTYTDWGIVDNNVWVDQENSRIEIYRNLRRDLHDPVARTRTERREWRFEVVLQEIKPPLVAFVSRGTAVPAHAREEADRYFTELYTILSGSGPLREDEILDSMGTDETVGEVTLPAGPG